MNRPLTTIFPGLAPFDQLLFAETVDKPGCGGARYAKDFGHLTAEAAGRCKHDPKHKSLWRRQSEFCVRSCPLSLHETGEGSRVEVKAVSEHGRIKSQSS